MALPPIPRKTYPELTAATDVQDADLLATYRTPGPLRKLTAGTFLAYIQAGVGFIASGLGAVQRTMQGKMRDTISVLDFIPVAEHAAILAGTSTYDATAAINAAHAAAATVHYPGSYAKARYNATAITMPFAGGMIGDGRDNVRLVQIAATDSNFITLTTGGIPGDITGGAQRFVGMTIEPANVARTCIKVGPDVRASMMVFENVTLKSQATAGFSTRPYVPTAGQIGVDIDGSGATGVSFLGVGRGLTIQGFDTAFRAANVVNDWSMDWSSYMLDNRIAFDLDDCSGFAFHGDVESGMANARSLVPRGATSHILDLARRHELTQAGSAVWDFTVGGTGNNLRSLWPNVQVNGDGGAIPGGKWVGTPPADFVFNGYYQDGATLRPFMYAGGKVLLPTEVQFGGTGLGNGDILIGRNAGGAQGRIRHDGSFLEISQANGVKIPGLIFPQTQFGSGYLEPFVMGSYSFWVDSSGRLRISAGTPSSDTDGVVVGTQT
jgi:hypothetical protein